MRVSSVRYRTQLENNVHKPSERKQVEKPQSVCYKKALIVCITKTLFLSLNDSKIVRLLIINISIIFLNNFEIIQKAQLVSVLQLTIILSQEVLTYISRKNTNEL